MSVSLIVEVAISMVFLYLLGSQVVLSIYELWAGYTNSRGKFLYRRLKGTLGVATTQALYAQKPIAALSPAGQVPPTSKTEQKLAFRLGKDGLPAYIPADLFAATLLAMIAPEAKKSSEILTALTAAPTTKAADDQKSVDERMLTWFDSAENPNQLKPLLEKLFAGLAADAPLADCQKSVAGWYDDYGERLTGWYKRQVRAWLFLIGLVVAVVGNIDSPFIIRYLWAHPQLSSSIADAGTKEAGATDGAKIRDATTAATTLNPPAAMGSANSSAQAAQPLPNADSLKKLSSRLTMKNDSLQQVLRVSKAQIQALDKRLHGLGFPIGRADSVRADSMELPRIFYVRQQSSAIRKGPVLFPDSGRYLRYARRDTLIAKHKGAYWQKSYLSLKSVPTDSLKDGRDRSNPNAGFGPFFGPQSQSPGLTLLGWLLTALALSVGAPFWFDLLCRLVNIRNLGIKPPRPEQ